MDSLPQARAIRAMHASDLGPTKAVLKLYLGEWLGGSGGGWQDSGGIWPGVKAIEGQLAQVNDPEYNISRGCLLPKHRLLENDIHQEFEKKIISSFILMHGGMTSNVGPILEMVTEKYLLRSEKEWNARGRANSIYNEITNCLRNGDIKKLASLTTDNFNGPIKTIIPAAMIKSEAGNLAMFCESP